MNPWFRSVFMCGLVLAGSALTARLVKPKQPAPDYFPLHAGDWWKYRRTQVGTGAATSLRATVTRLDAGSGTYTMEIAKTAASGVNTFDTRYSNLDGWVVWLQTVRNNVSHDWKPPRRYLEKAPKIGDTWDWSGTLEGLDSTMNVKVIGKDQVLVPAGTFSTYCVHRHGTVGHEVSEIDDWYADGVGLVKDQDVWKGSVSRLELVNYNLKKP